MNIDILPIILIGCVLTYTLTRAAFHAWMRHRMKLVMLNEYAQNPKKYPSWEDFQATLNKRMAAAPKPATQDFRLTGTVLLILGLVCTFTGYTIGFGTWAVALYTGGIASAGLGVLLALFGTILHLTIQPDPVVTSREA